MPAKVRTFKEIAIEYGVNRNTLTIWLKPISKALMHIKGKRLLSWQIHLIYNFLDSPEFPISDEQSSDDIQ